MCLNKKICIWRIKCAFYVFSFLWNTVLFPLMNCWKVLFFFCPQAEKIFVHTHRINTKFFVLRKKMDSKSFSCVPNNSRCIWTTAVNINYTRVQYSISHKCIFKSNWMCALHSGRGRSHIDKGTEWETEAVSLQSHNWLNVIDFVGEINRSCRVALCPWQVNLPAFVLLCFFASATPPNTSFSTAVTWCPDHQTPFMTPTGDQSHCKAIHFVIRTACCPETFSDWLNYTNTCEYVWFCLLDKGFQLILLTKTFASTTIWRKDYKQMGVPWWSPYELSIP